jgi:hypothetical protein
MYAFKNTIGELNLSQESADIVECLQTLLSKMIEELIAEKDDKIMDLEEERKALLQDEQDLAAWALRHEHVPEDAINIRGQFGSLYVARIGLQLFWNCV